MLQLHDSTRRRIGLAGFFLFCLVPTALLTAWGVVRHAPSYVGSEAERLGSLWGLKVTLAGMRHLRPGVVEYSGLELADLETHGKVLRCARLEAAWETSTDAKGLSRPTLVLTASQPEVFLDQVGHLERLVQGLLTRHGDRDATVRLTAGEAVLRSGEASQPISEVRGKTEMQAAGSVAEIRFRWLPGDQGSFVLVRVVRNRQTMPPATGFELDTGATSLPCPVLAAGLRGMEQLGPRSRFCGYCWANETPDGWAGEIEGRFSDVDLESLVGDRFAHRLSGLAQVSLESARFRQGRIETAEGEIAAGPGTVTRSLIEAAVQGLEMATALEATPSPSVVRYEQLSARFRLTSHGLKITGGFQAGSVRAILVDRQSVLLTEPARAQPIAALVQAFAPGGGIQVPANRQADWLMRRLPLPEAAPRPASAIVPGAK